MASEQQRLESHNAFLAEARAAVIDMLKRPAHNIHASVRFSPSEVVFTWTPIQQQACVSETATSDPLPRSPSLPPQPEVDPVQLSPFVSEGIDELPTFKGTEAEFEIKAKCDALAVEPTLVSHLERADRIDYYNAANEVVMSVPVAGWGGIDRDLRVVIREYHALRSSGDQTTVQQEGPLDPCVHDEPKGLIAPTPIDAAWGDIVHIIRLDEEDDGVFTYIAMFRYPVQLTCGHDIACYPRDVRREIRSYWRTELGRTVCPHFLGDMRCDVLL